MNIDNINNFIRGWFVGNFEPSLFKTEAVEVAYKVYKAGDREKKHYHKKATEISVIVSGTVMMNGKVFKKGDIIIMKPNDIADFVVLDDAENIVVKIPGVTNDKFEVANE